jgi:hypothetical protein
MVNEDFLSVLTNMVLFEFWTVPILSFAKNDVNWFFVNWEMLFTVYAGLNVRCIIHPCYSVFNVCWHCMYHLIVKLFKFTKKSEIFHLPYLRFYYGRSKLNGCSTWHPSKVKWFILLLYFSQENYLQLIVICLFKEYIFPEKQLS